MDILDGDAKRDQESDQSSSTLSQLETEVEGDWRKPGNKRLSDECWLFPSLLSKFRRYLLLSISPVEELSRLIIALFLVVT